MLTGHPLPTPRLPRLHAHTPARQSHGTASLVAFGAADATASLSCTLAVLLAVIAQALATGSTTGLAGVFTAYTLGAATILILISTTAAVVGGALTHPIKRLLPAVPRVAGTILTLAGLYLITYWTPIAVTGEPAASPLNRVIIAVAGPLTTWVAGHTTLISLAAIAVVIATATWTLARRRTPPATVENADPRQVTNLPDRDTTCC